MSCYFQASDDDVSNLDVDKALDPNSDLEYSQHNEVRQWEITQARGKASINIDSTMIEELNHNLSYWKREELSRSTK